MTARFIAPEIAAGKTEYETGGLRLRVVEPRGRVERHGSSAGMLTKLVVENKREVFAWIKAEKSCLIDPEDGTTNLIWRYACLPGGCWTKLDGTAPGFITVNWSPSFLVGEIREPRPLGGTQRVLLDVAWEDGQSESIDLAYEVEVSYPDTR